MMKVALARLRRPVTGPNPAGSGTVETTTGFDGAGRPVTTPAAPGSPGAADH